MMKCPFYAKKQELKTPNVFELYDKDGKKNMYIDDNGNLTMRGTFKTGEEGEARTVIDGNGINSYNAAGQLDGFVVNPNSGYFTNFAMYYRGNEGFKIETQAPKGAWNMFCCGAMIIAAKSNGGNLIGKWTYGNEEIATIAEVERRIKAAMPSTPSA